MSVDLSLLTYNSGKENNWNRLSCKTFMKSLSNSCIKQLFGLLVPIVVPPVHIYVVYNFWCNNKRAINKQLCSCSCWDSVFKGPYESGVGTYKHVYFNSTSNSFKIWTLTVLSIVLLYGAVCRLAFLLINGRLRCSMMILFVSSMFSHYYSWWMFFNYWNDEYYSQWYHQLFFSLTELVSTALVLLLADREVSFSTARVLPVVAVAALHILAAARDQFVLNVLRGEGYSYQVVRDVGFMVPDVLHLLVFLWQLKLHCKSVGKKQCILLGVFIIVGLIIVSAL